MICFYRFEKKKEEEIDSIMLRLIFFIQILCNIYKMCILVLNTFSPNIQFHIYSNNIFKLYILELAKLG